MPIVIKKRVSLDFLGKENKDDYLEFKAIPLRDFGPMMDEIEKISEDAKKSLAFIVDALTKQFLAGKFQGQEVKADDLNDLDPATATTCFEIISGQLSPKVKASSTTQSTTDDLPPES